MHFGLVSQKLSSVAYKGQRAHSLPTRCFCCLHLCSHLRLRILPQGQATKIKPFPLADLLPKRNMSQYYRYSGSLTTPPCARAVVWTLYQVPIYISWTQVGLSPVPPDSGARFPRQ